MDFGSHYPLVQLARGAFGSFPFQGKTTRSFDCGSRKSAGRMTFGLASAQDDSDVTFTA